MEAAWKKLEELRGQVKVWWESEAHMRAVLGHGEIWVGQQHDSTAHVQVAARTSAPDVGVPGVSGRASVRDARCLPLADWSAVDGSGVCLAVKGIGEPDAGKLHVRFDEGVLVPWHAGAREPQPTERGRNRWGRRYSTRTSALLSLSYRSDRVLLGIITLGILGITAHKLMSFVTRNSFLRCRGY